MTTNYPLPQSTILLSSHSRTQEAEFEATSSRSGKVYFKKKAQNAPTIRNVTFKLTEAQAQIFISWFNGGINKGFDPFYMNMQTEWGNQSILCRFLPDSLLNASRSSWNLWQYKAQLVIENYSKPSYYPNNIWFMPEYTKDEQRSYLDIIVNTLMPKV